MKNSITLAAISIAATAQAASCPPEGWTRCSQSWPPPPNGHCCSTAGWLGNSAAHCTNGGIDVTKASGNNCCVKNGTWSMDCHARGEKLSESDSSSSEEVVYRDASSSESEEYSADKYSVPNGQVKKITLPASKGGWECKCKAVGGTKSKKTKKDKKDKKKDDKKKKDKKKKDEKKKEEEKFEFPADSECPPKGWDRCSQGGAMRWPPPADGLCCGTSGWLGKTWAHCNNGGINAMDKCCKKNKFGFLRCKLPEGSCEPAPDNCTGDAKIDAVLKKSDIGCTIGLTKLNPTYTWAGFCKAIRQYNNIGDRKLYLGDGNCKKGLSNIAALLAQAMWESGGDAPWSACDENNYTKSKTASCTQRADGSKYADLVGQPHHCEVDMNMQMTAVTYAAWTPGPMKCVPGTETAGCCWWGRGAIQTTGPNNYGLLNHEVFQRIPELQHINLCQNPEGICDTSDGNKQKNWLGAVHYWAHNVQGFSNADYKHNFMTSLNKFVDGNFSLSASRHMGSDFASGTGSVVNNGFWGSGAHKNEKRVNNFRWIVDELKQAGMGTCDA